jgi:phospholipid/cholesterol/gamma-HCH transport system permease protein
MRRQGGYNLKVEGGGNSALLLALSGHIGLSNAGRLKKELTPFLEERRPVHITIELKDVEYLDSAGALTLFDLEERMKALAIPFEYASMPENVKKIMALIDREAVLAVAPPRKLEAGLFEEIGAGARRFIADAASVMAFQGDLLAATLYSLRHFRSIRWGDVLLYLRKTGLEGLPIIALISGLLGLIMAFMSSLQLKQFGANIYIASLVAVAVVRELGPIMTAILVAGRSGSAFAAEIGTMIVNEEVDALAVMGFDTTRFIAVPKVFAAVIAVPILTLYADFFGIAGGAFVGVVGLDLSLSSYIDYTKWSITVFDVVSSLVKSVVFAILIAGIGCQRGFQTQGGALAVGISTTSAVVSAIFLIIVTDSVFAILLHYVR